MIDHMEIVVSDLSASYALYEALLGSLGYVSIQRSQQAMSFGEPEVIAKGADPHGEIWIIESGDSKVYRPMHVAFRAHSIEEIKRFHAAGVAHGGIDNGAAGPRPHYAPGYYAAYILDRDGNNIEAVLHTYLPLSSNPPNKTLSRP